MDKYLESSKFIDWETPVVLEKSKQLSQGLSSHEDIARACFMYVRDEIKHSYDYRLNPVTCAASDVLKNKTGYCYAKSHLLASLLRANKIPAGMCYQRLTIKNNKPPFCLHGLNAVLLPNTGWYRVDARGNKARGNKTSGNKKDVDAKFTPPVENLAFPIIIEGEADLPEIWSEPLPDIISVLTNFKTFEQVANNLPDIQIMKS